MPQQITKLNRLPLRRQKAVYWPRTGTDGQGDPVYGDAVEVNCRWDYGLEQELDGEQTNVKYKSVVYPSIFCEEEGYLWLGELAEASNTAAGEDPTVNTGDGGEIRQVKRITNFRQTTVLYVAYL